MLNLDDKEWKAFPLTDIFPNIQRGKRLKKSDHIPGNMPYVSSSALLNGVDGFVSNAQNVRVFSDCLSLANSGSVGSSFYEPFTFVASDHITHLKNPSLNKYHYLFIATITKRIAPKYNFNREINDKRIARELILLPVTKNGDPDYLFMEEYIKEREHQSLNNYIDFATARLHRMIADIPANNIMLLQDKTWTSFRLLDLFTYERGNQNNMSSLSSGETMLISAKKINNGLKGFYKSNNKKKVAFRGNCITLNNDGDGGVGLAYYQPQDFLLDTHVYALYPIESISKHTMLFIAQCISKQRICFNHGYPINQDRLKTMHIMLPTTEEGSPDYIYMEQFIKVQEVKKLQGYISFAEKRLLEIAAQI